MCTWLGNYLCIKDICIIYSYTDSVLNMYPKEAVGKFLLNTYVQLIYIAI